MTLPPQQRSQEDGPWCWQNKAARRLIRKRFSELNCISSALSIYDALCELSSDMQSNRFEMATPTIAKTAGVGTRTAQGILPKLKVFGFIDIEDRKFPGTNMDAPSIFTLFKVVGEGNSETNGCAPVGNGCAPLRNERKQTSLRTSEESVKESSEESQKTTPTPNPPSSEPVAALPQPQAVGAGKENDGLLSPEELWLRVCQVLGRPLNRPRSEPEQEELLRCSAWLTEAELQRLEDFERRKQANPSRRRNETAYAFLVNAQRRLSQAKGQVSPRASIAQPAQAAQPPVIDESDEEAINRTLPIKEIWQRACRLVGQPNEPQTDRARALLQDLHGIREWKMRLVERFTAYEKTKPGSPGKRSVLTLLRDFDQILSFAENWEEDRKADFERNRQAKGPQPTAHSAPTLVAGVNEAAPATPVAQPQRPSVDEVFAYMSTAKTPWPREVAEAYLANRTRTDPPWHLPATNERPARPISADWKADVCLFLKNWNEIEDKKRAKAAKTAAENDDLPF